MNNSSSANALDPTIVADLIEQSEIAVAEARRALAAKSDNELFDFIADDVAALKQQLFAPQSIRALMAGIDALLWLNDNLSEWLGERGVADTLSQSVDNNITSQMGLDLLDVADAIRPHAAAVSFLRRLDGSASLTHLIQVDGGRETLEAINDYLGKYGMRCAGEIDITRTRWRERPAALVPMILANIDRFKPGEAKRRFHAGLTRAKAAEQDVLKRLRTLPDGAAKAAQAKAAIDRLRAFIGYREYPKYGWVSRMDLHKQAMLREAQRLLDSGVIDRIDDIFYLRFDELREVVRTQRADRELIIARRAEFATYERLASPRVLTSHGEVLFGDFERNDLPANALPGLAVSAGCVEGRARIITDIATPGIEPGDILVTTYTDPSWTPLFITVAGLVTEAGGQMSHGAVIAREYGLPAVVAVRDATRRIRDGQRIRLDGTNGVVTLLPTE
jgi:pyruvate,water dikinase